MKSNLFDPRLNALDPIISLAFTQPLASATTFDLASTTQRLRLQSLIWLFNTMPASHRSQDNINSCSAVVPHTMSHPAVFDLALQHNANFASVSRHINSSLVISSTSAFGSVLGFVYAYPLLCSSPQTHLGRWHATYFNSTFALGSTVDST